MKKLVALFLIGTLGAGLMSGCGNTSSQTSGSSSAAESETSSVVSGVSSAASETSSAVLSSGVTETAKTAATASLISEDTPYTYNGEEITISTGTATEENGYVPVILSYKGNDTEVDAETYGPADGESFVFEENGDVYAAVCCTYDDDWRTTFLLKLNKDAETFDKIDDIDAYLNDDIANVSPENIVMASKVDDFGSYEGTRSYKIDGDKFVPNTSEYTFTLSDRDGQKLTVVQGFEALKNGEEVTINEGDVLYAVAVDEDNKIFKFMVGDDTENIYEVNYEYDSDDVTHSIGGVSEYDLFEMVPYTG